MTIADEPVGIQLGDDHVRIATQYEVRIGVFDQPASFSLTLGSGLTSAEIIRRYKPRTPFQLVVGDRRQFAGYTDGYRLSGSSGATEVSIHGRDVLAQAHDSFHERESSYVAMSHRDLVEKMLDELNLMVPFGGRRVLVLASNSDTRESRVGASIPAVDDTVEAELLDPVGTRGNAQVVLRARLGERWMDLVERHLRQSGLFIWCSADGDAVVGRPNYHQPPTYRIVRRRGMRPRADNVIHAEYEVDYRPRYSEVVIYGRASGRKYARTTTSGAYTDDELVSEGVRKVLVLRDVDVTSIAHAEQIARRHLAEGRRRGFSLTYTVAGHITQRIDSPLRVCWAPDTMVEVDDDEIGIHSTYWLEQVVFRRSSGGTTTQLRLLPPEALVFGEDA